MARRFSHIVEALIETLASPWAFLVAATVVVAGFLFIPRGDLREDFHLLLALVTLLLVFLVEHAENRDTDAIHVKLNELLEAVEGARTEKIGIEELSEPEIRRLAQRERDERRASDGREVDEVDGRAKARPS